MTKDSIYELQKIDCNCNDCKFLVRDFNKRKDSENFHKELQLKEFNRKKENKEIRENAQFQFNKTGLLYFGNCTTFNKPISFIPNVLQLDTQNCFVHRKD